VIGLSAIRPRAVPKTLSSVFTDVTQDPNKTLLVFPDALKWLEPPGPGSEKDWICRPSQLTEAGFPSGADLDTDIAFLVHLVNWIKTEYPAIERIWLMGFSRGSEMAMLAATQPAVVEVDGYALSHRGWPDELDMGDLDTTRAIGLWTAPNDPLEGEGDTATFAATAAAFAAAFGATEDGSSPTTKNCGGTNNMQVHTYSGGGPFKWWSRNGGHVWISVSNCYEENYFRVWLHNQT